MGGRQALVRAAAWAAVGAVAFSASGIGAKLVGGLPSSEVSWFRALGALVAVAILFRHAALDWRQARDGKWHMVRIASGVFSLICLMHAFSVLPIGLASLILFTRVLLMPVVARILLSEVLTRRAAIAAAIGFAGAVVAIWPAIALRGETLGVLAAVGASLGTALSQTAVRRLALTNAPEIIVAIYGAGAVAVLSPIVALQWVTPAFVALPYLLILALGGAVAQYAAVVAFRHAPVRYVAPFDFLTVPASAILGFAVFGDRISGWDISGAALIFAASWYLIAGRDEAAR